MRRNDTKPVLAQTKATVFLLRQTVEVEDDCQHVQLDGNSDVLQKICGGGRGNFCFKKASSGMSTAASKILPGDCIAVYKDDYEAARQCSLNFCRVKRGSAGRKEPLSLKDGPQDVLHFSRARRFDICFKRYLFCLAPSSKFSKIENLEEGTILSLSTTKTSSVVYPPLLPVDD